jgi:hypothetical protein
MIMPEGICLPAALQSDKRRHDSGVDDDKDVYN